eukprot:CAMPEP_0114140326 /NCGR_PEP_ID=MMETSP0043_2-20121206/17322_1 /TAXON_ID=464988 /ORGANISM="Hemiselmis andersenii, Strain CCMP644" /LENGTH=123 /DNA_ID=CAMNT_0001234407 /DNA_START=410 /DNA_END=778 /DNA_ORIENTATION=+
MRACPAAYDEGPDAVEAESSSFCDATYCSEASSNRPCERSTAARSASIVALRRSLSIAALSSAGPAAPSRPLTCITIPSSCQASLLPGRRATPARACAGRKYVPSIASASDEAAPSSSTRSSW